MQPTNRAILRAPGSTRHRSHVGPGRRFARCTRNTDVIVGEAPRPTTRTWIVCVQPKHLRHRGGGASAQPVTGGSWRLLRVRAELRGDEVRVSPVCRWMRLSTPLRPNQAPTPQRVGSMQRIGRSTAPRDGFRRGTAAMSIRPGRRVARCLGPSQAVPGPSAVCAPSCVEQKCAWSPVCRWMRVRADSPAESGAHTPTGLADAANESGARSAAPRAGSRRGTAATSAPGATSRGAQNSPSQAVPSGSALYAPSCV